MAQGFSLDLFWQKLSLSYQVKEKHPKNGVFYVRFLSPKITWNFPFFTPLGWVINFVAEVSRVNPLGGKNATLDTPSKKFNV